MLVLHARLVLLGHDRVPSCPLAVAGRPFPPSREELNEERGGRELIFFFTQFS